MHRSQFQTKKSLEMHNNIKNKDNLNRCIRENRKKIQYIGDAYIQGLEKDGWSFGTHFFTNSKQAKVKENIWTPLPVKSQERMSFKIVDLNQLEEKIFDFVVISGDEIQSLKMSSCFNRPVLLLGYKFFCDVSLSLIVQSFYSVK